jgi:predicted GIY-YIG superfamily endonuclease
MKDGRFWFGHATDVDKRLNAHNLGKSEYTKPYIPWKLFAVKEVDNHSDAVYFERRLKTLKTEEGMLVFMIYNDFKLAPEYQERLKNIQNRDTIK